MDFLRYLYENGKIDADQIGELQKDCSETHDKVGNVLLVRHILSKHELATLLTMYSSQHAEIRF